MHNWMCDVLAQDGLPNVGRLALIGELWRVNTNDNDLCRIPLLNRPQRGQNVQAVDSAIRPEIEDDQATAQVSERHRSTDVKPGERRREIGGTY